MTCAYRRRAAPLLPSVAYWKTRAILEDVARTQAPPAIVVRERAHLLAIARREGIVVRIAGDCDAQQGYAFRARHRVEVSPLVSMFACATLAHEIGHALDPSHASRERRELNAWRWAKRHMLTWNADCRENRNWALKSYRPYATASERREIDLMCKGA